MQFTSIGFEEIGMDTQWTAVSKDIPIQILTLPHMQRLATEGRAAFLLDWMTSAEYLGEGNWYSVRELGAMDVEMMVEALLSAPYIPPLYAGSIVQVRTYGVESAPFEAVGHALVTAIKMVDRENLHPEDVALLNETPAPRISPLDFPWAWYVVLEKAMDY